MLMLLLTSGKGTGELENPGQKSAATLPPRVHPEGLPHQHATAGSSILSPEISISSTAVLRHGG